MGYPILFFHGTPGNDLQANIFRAFSSTKIITWKRDRPIPYSGPAHLLAFSGGGPYALEHANIHKETSLSLTLWSALTESGNKKFFPGPVARIILNTFGRRILKKKSFFIWKRFLESYSDTQEVYDYSIDNKKSQKMFWEFLSSMVPIRMTKQLKNEIAYLTKYCYKGGPINVPSYIVHDENDKNVDISNSINIQKHLTNVVKYQRLKSTGHLCFFGEQAHDTLRDWSNWIANN